MSGAILQLVLQGEDTKYLTSNPDITFFKSIYRRHTNFAKEEIMQKFTGVPDFGKKMSCSITKCGDLINKTSVQITLPKIYETNDPYSKFAWVNNIGYALIKSVEIEINGKIISSQYGEFIFLWHLLTGYTYGNHKDGLNKLVGNVPELTDFTSSKDEYKLIIPLTFWFCNSYTSSLPIVCLQSDVKINVEFEEARKCYKTTPTHSITCRDDIVNFIPNEYIEQNINGDIRAGIFQEYDIVSKTLYYYKTTKDKLLSAPVPSTLNITNNTDVNEYLQSSDGIVYSIVGQTSNYSTFAELNATSNIYKSQYTNIHLVDAYLIITYIYLDRHERTKFIESRHEYLIEQISFTPNVKISDISYSLKLRGLHPTKLMLWIIQFDYLYKNKDYYNYTDSYKYENNYPTGDSLILNQSILFSGNERISMRNSTYFDQIQPYQIMNTKSLTGLNMYSYAEKTFDTCPSGSVNMGQIENVEISMKLSSNINVNNTASARGYCVEINILRILNGIGGIVFFK